MVSVRLAWTCSGSRAAAISVTIRRHCASWSGCGLDRGMNIGSCSGP